MKINQQRKFLSRVNVHLLVEDRECVMDAFEICLNLVANVRTWVPMIVDDTY